MLWYYYMICIYMGYFDSSNPKNSNLTVILQEVSSTRNVSGE